MLFFRWSMDLRQLPHGCSRGFGLPRPKFEKAPRNLPRRHTTSPADNPTSTASRNTAKMVRIHPNDVEEFRLDANVKDAVHGKGQGLAALGQEQG